MIPDIALVLCVTAATLVLFLTERWPMDVTALIVLVTLAGLHLLGGVPLLERFGFDLRSAFPTPAEALSGLSNPATVTVACMFVLSAGVQRTGCIDRLGQWLTRVVGRSATRHVG